ncbi:uncharacterized protein EKO05_0009978 [Ascochyta rabiei]|uniref:Uncharacterized protein n=1 Tax=Didymella rabiei TaxID=5454 RepID=A0A162YD91_DIDRA|nr:uncharacterized protein EKO05_0009978 [Ascochyta rabiei]KZM19971.1 hypothetical protein ST47_g8896 [Ascochyta rabiei]UPX19725.1 hypothetical protein EKO05_0009978 [Ascochyta rabiei]
MHDEHPHPLLAQVPLTVSPFLSLPHSVPLPYSYVTLPSTLPPSILQQNASADPSQPPQYVTSSSGQSAHPDAILRSCVALQEHLDQLEIEARKTLQAFRARREKEELDEKRRVAPGWLDSGVHILKPENVDEAQPVSGEAQGKGLGQMQDVQFTGAQGGGQSREGEELDRVFGGLSMK